MRRSSAARAALRSACDIRERESSSERAQAQWRRGCAVSYAMSAAVRQRRRIRGRGAPPRVARRYMLRC